MSDVEEFLPEASPVLLDQLCVLIGPLHSGKTKLLFQLAVNHAKEGREVLFVTSHVRMEKSADTLGATILEQTCLKRIHIKYIDTEDELTRYVANAHLIRPFPQVLIIDNFSSYFLIDEGAEESASTFRKGEREGMCALFHVMALIQEARQFAIQQRQQNKQSSNMLIVLGCTTPAAMVYPRFQYLFARHRATFVILQHCAPCASKVNGSRCVEMTKIVPLSSEQPSSLHVHP